MRFEFLYYFRFLRAPRSNDGTYCLRAARVDGGFQSVEAFTREGWFYDAGQANVLLLGDRGMTC